MSSTRNEEAYTSNWETPRWVVRRLLEDLDLPAGDWLEPGAGNGRIIEAMEEDRPGAYSFTAVEIRAECIPILKCLPNAAGRVMHTDFLTWDARSHRPKEAHCSESSYFTGAILNPAFPISVEVLQKCLVICDQVHMLQRLNWLGGGTNNGKNEFLQNFMPDVRTLPDRVQFLLDGEFPRYPPGAVDSHGKSIAGRKMPGDSIDYAWYSWHHKAERFRDKGYISALRSTTLEERLLG